MRASLLMLFSFLWTQMLLAQIYPFQNVELNDEERIENIVSLLTLDEKIECLSTNPSVPRLGLKASGHIEGLHGVAMGTPGNWGKEHPVATTTFPQSVGMGCTWDTTSMRIMGEIEGYEARYLFQSPKYNRGGLVVRAPNADIARDIRWGRTEECYGEDAFFNGVLSVAFIKGLQGQHPNYWQTASLMKHFLANSNEDSRTWSSSDFNERLFREYYSVPFRMGIEQGGSRAFMAAYNRVNGIPMMVHPMLKDIAVKEWGQNGIICTDGGALKLLISDHKYYESISEGAAEAIKNGIGQFLDDYKDSLNLALDQGMVTEGQIDEVLKGNFRIMLKLGLLDSNNTNPYTQIGLNNESEPWLKKEVHQKVREITCKSIVLLKNENLLPLNTSDYKSIVVIGDKADEVFLDWYSGTPPYTISPLQGIKTKYPDGNVVKYFKDGSDGEVVKAASAADVVIVCVGNHPTGGAGWAEVTHESYGKEAVDRKQITLEDEQLVEDLFKVNKKIVLVLMSSFPYAINWSKNNIPAIVHMSHNSQETGNALADVLFGDYNPAGRLVHTWPVSEEHLPELLDYDICKGRTYMYSQHKPLFAFGYGLSYSTFTYSNMELSPKSDSIRVAVDVQNSGSFDGEEVVQVYVRFPGSKVPRARQQLVGFSRVFIEKGDVMTVQIPIAVKQFEYWNDAAHSFILEDMDVEIQVGASSDDIRLTQRISTID